MRAALLVSTLAFLAGSPALAQCVYVACNGGAQGGPAYQQPTYQAPALQPRAAQMPAPGAGSDYDDGYAAGLAARPSTTRQAARPHRAATTRAKAATRPRHASTSSTSNHRVASRTTAARSHAAPVAKRRVATASHNAHPRSQAVRRVTTARPAPHRIVTAHTPAPRHYQDQIKDRAATYRPAVYGNSTTMASLMSRSSSYSSTTTWSGPASTVRQGTQVCGWGARIVTNNHGYAQRQAVWVCQCPQGWRPLGY